MTEWYTSETIGEQPEVLDTTSSPVTVYERQNIMAFSREDDGVTVTGWMYQERKWTKTEYEAYQHELESPTTQLLMQTLSELDLKIEMMGV